ncbi:MAG: hypothetical protein K2G87_04385 [Oscillospiraceae bacterium]|nr:hypothetical protein [Oscillospiraceae bacterium]
MNSETDVLEFDFPDYEEPYPPFPDVKIELFDKEDSYSRNRDIADKLYADELEDGIRRAEKLWETERERTRLNRASPRSNTRPLKKILSVIALFLLIEGALLFACFGPELKSNTDAKPDRITISEKTYIPPTPLPEPFEWVDYSENGTVTYSNDKMSFMFKPANAAVSDTSAAFDVTVRNLTNEKYWLMIDSFYLTDRKETSFKHTIYYTPDQVLLYTLEDENYHIGKDPIAFGFDSSGECSFTISFDMSEFESTDGTFIVGYDRDSFLADLVENTADDFDIILFGF